MPYLTKVAATGAFEETILQPLPLKPYHPYRQVKSGPSIRIFAPVQLAIGWLPDGKMNIRTTKSPDGSILLAAHHRQVAKEQKLLVSSLDHIQVPVQIQEAK